MKRNVIWTIVFALAMEFQINVVLQGSLSGLIGALGLYAVLGCVTWYSMPWIARRFEDPGNGFWVALVSHGVAGLVVIEWGCMGHRPGNIPDHLLDAIAQVGMFAWWCAIAAMPLVIVSAGASPSRRSILWFYGAYALTSTLLSFRMGLAPVILMMPPVYVGFCWFYWRHASALRRARPAPTIAPGDDLKTGWRG